MAFLNKNFLSLHGRLFGLFRGLISSGDSFLGGDGFQGVLESTADTLTGAGTTLATATALTAVKNRFSTVASGTGAVLPASQPGMRILVINDGSNVLAIFPASGETIDGGSASASVNLTNAFRAYFECLTAGKWVSAGHIAVST